MTTVLFQPSFRANMEAPGDMRHPNHPLIVQARRAAGMPEPIACDLAVEKFDDVLVCEPLIGGLNVYAAHEEAAHAAVDVLRANHGATFDLFGPEVRYWPGQPVREPVMAVDLRLPLLFGAFVRREVLRRRGTIHATEPARRIVALRGEAPLASLLGFERWLHALTDGRATVRTSLLRYAPVGGSGPAPGPLAA